MAYLKAGGEVAYSLIHAKCRGDPRPWGAGRQSAFPAATYHCAAEAMSRHDQTDESVNRTPTNTVCRASAEGTFTSLYGLRHHLCFPHRGLWVAGQTVLAAEDA